MIKRNVRRVRGVGQTPSNVSLPTCASLDLASTVPQMVLMGGGGVAMAVGIIGAIFSDNYKQQFAIAAGAGLAANLVGGIWAAATAQQVVSQQLNPQCTGPGVAMLDGASVNPDQTTPVGQLPAAAMPAGGPAVSTVAVPAGSAAA